MLLPEEPRRRLSDRRRRAAAAATGAGARRIARSGYRWTVILVIAVAGAAYLVQGLFTGSVVFTATDAERSGLQAASAVTACVAGAALLALAIWLTRMAEPAQHGLGALAGTVVASIPPWGWLAGDAGYGLAALLFLLVVAASARVSRLEREEQLPG